jgi:hypothetical protein
LAPFATERENPVSLLALDATDKVKDILNKFKKLYFPNVISVTS